MEAGLVRVHPVMVKTARAPNQKTGLAARRVNPPRPPDKALLLFWGVFRFKILGQPCQAPGNASQSLGRLDARGRADLLLSDLAKALERSIQFAAHLFKLVHRATSSRHASENAAGRAFFGIIGTPSL
jgi:hypothetical protein